MSVSKHAFSSYLTTLYKLMIESIHELETKGGSMIAMWLSTSADGLVESEWRYFCARMCSNIAEYESVLSDLSVKKEPAAKDEVGEHLHRARFRLKDQGNDPQPQDVSNVIFSTHALYVLRQNAFKRFLMTGKEAGL